MKYKDFDGTIEELVAQKLREVEVKHNVKVLHAIESGSRAWGFASPDSDYDVRFIYVRPMEDYLRLEELPDYIDWELDETLDINGWDARKALTHIRKSNATVFEWNRSPIVYQTTECWKQISMLADQYFSCKAAMHHYYGTARKNYAEYLTGDMVKYKKYFYVLRPVLACKWIEQKQSPPPVLFDELMEAVLEEEMKPEIERLLWLKKQMTEGETAPKIETINRYLEENIRAYKEKLEMMKDDRNADWTVLDQAFLKLIKKG